MTKLQQRREQYGIPALVHQPAGKNCVVYRLPSEEKTAGGIYVPDAHREVKPLGVLLAAGLEALDILRDNGIELGDVVQVARFAGWEKEAARDPANEGKKLIDLRVEDINGSVDLIERLQQGDVVLKYDEETREHYYYWTK